MSNWLVDTLLTTGALIALVLVLRRPVARLFGPAMAYALWVVPFARLLLPPLVLPASLAPAAKAVAVQEIVVGAPVQVADVARAAAFDWSSWLFALWLAGATLFLAWRVWTYRSMRARLLADARPMGREGQVRIVESPEVPAPVAFGLIDKVVALPTGFMANTDRRARDLAIAHELAHHAGHDLAANFAVQPLLALHWFNPLAWAGWRAMRRDQEAACDARVMEGCDAATRAVYGRLIAGFAQGPRLAMAAPMACPMLGEKSIVHRLRSLTMSPPSPRRRLAGRAAIAAAVLALPLTASISYAEAGNAPQSPTPPAAPAAPEGTPKVVKRIVIVDKPADGAAVDDSKLVTRVIERDGKTIVYKSPDALSDAEVERRVATALASVPQTPELPMLPEAPLPPGATGPTPPAPPVPPVPGTHQRRIVIVDSNEQRTLSGTADPEAIARACAEGQTTEVVSSAGEGDHRQQVRMRFCNRGGEAAHALAGLRTARERIAADRNLSDAIRADVLRQLDAEIEKLSKRG